MTLDSTIRERVVFIGGKVGGVDCPNCQFRGDDVALDAYMTSSVTCPDCGTTILTEEQRAELRQAHKL